MKVILERKKTNIYAIGDFDVETKALVVLKGAKVSSDIHRTDKFRGANTIEKHRAEYVVEGLTVKDATFKRASTAANFVTGSSTNGLTAWKTEDGRTLKEVLANK